MDRNKTPQTDGLGTDAFLGNFYGGRAVRAILSRGLEKYPITLNQVQLKEWFARLLVLWKSYLETH